MFYEMKVRMNAMLMLSAIVSEFRDLNPNCSVPESNVHSVLPHGQTQIFVILTLIWVAPTLIPSRMRPSLDPDWGEKRADKHC